jgi:cell division septum initiation protein DivIVA
VALAGIKELIQQNQELRQTIEELQKRIAKLESIK